MMGSFRKKVARAVTVVLFSLLILSFAVWGIGDMVTGVGQTSAVAEVGNQEIEQEEFSSQFSREMNSLQQSLGGDFDVEQAQALGVVDQVLRQMITRALYEEQAEEMGLVVSDEQIRSRILREPAFRDELGNFDRARFERALQVNNMSEGEFVAALRADIKREQLANSLTGGVAVPSSLVETLYAYQQEKRIAETVLVPYDSITEVPSPDEATLKNFYDEHAQEFQAPEYRAITLIRLTPEDFLDEVAVPEEQLRQEFEARRGEFATPERRTMEQIVLPDRATAERAKQRLEAGADFAAVAQEFTGSESIDLGVMTKDAMLDALADPAFSLPPDSPSKPIESPFGWHILRVTEVEPAQEPNFEKAREQLRRDLASRHAIDAMVSIANQLDDELAAGATLEEAARTLDLEVRKIPAIDRQGKAPGGQPIEELPPANEFLPVVFETAAGESSLLTETGTGGYFIVRVDGVTPAAPRPFAEVREQVRERWTGQQREKLARERAQAIAERVANGQELSAVAEAEGLEVRRTEALTRTESDLTRALSPQLPQKLFEMSEGEVTTVPAPEGQLVAKLAAIQPADPQADESAVAALREQLANSIKGDMLAEYARALQKNFQVSVNRRLVDEVVDRR